MQNAGPQQPDRRWKRTAAIAVLLLAGGAVVNVAVAGWIAMRDFDASSPDCRLEHASADPSRLGEIVVCSVECTGATRFAFSTSNDPNDLCRYVPDLNATVASWATMFLRDDELIPDHWGFRMVLGVGWPARSVCGSLYFDEWPMDRTMINTEWALSGPLAPTSPYFTDSKIIPLRPIPFGFAINTLFYAALLWLLFFAPFAARRMIRRRRRLCEKCAYPIGESPVCTECGAAVSRRVQS